MITDRDLATKLAYYGQPLRVPKAAAIFDSGAAADGLYIIRSGEVKVILKDSLGNAIWSRRVSENAILGMSAAIGGHGHCVSAVAVEHTETIFLAAELLRRMVRDDPSLGIQVVAAISQEVREVRNKLQMLANDSASQNSVATQTHSALNKSKHQKN